MANTNLDIVIRAKNLADRAFKRLGNQIRKVGELARKMGRLIKKAMFISVAAIAAGSVALIKLGMDAVESENLFRESFGGMAEAAREWSEEISKSLGLNAFAVRRQAGILYVMSESMGVAKDEAFEMAKGLTQLAYDMASFYNLKPEIAFEKLQAGISGESEPLKRLGILVLENTIKQTEYAKAILATGRELTEAEKVMARYHAIMQQTSKAQGDLARTMDSPANRLRRMKEQIVGMLTKMGLMIVESESFKNMLISLGDSIDKLVKGGKMEDWTRRGIVGMKRLVDVVKGGWKVIRATVEDVSFINPAFRAMGEILWQTLAGAWHAWSAMVRGSVDYIFKPLFLAFRREWYSMLQEIADTLKDIPGMGEAGWNLQTRVTEGRTRLIEEKIRVQQGGDTDIERAKQVGAKVFAEEMDKAYDKWAQIPRVWQGLIEKADTSIAASSARSAPEGAQPFIDAIKRLNDRISNLTTRAGDTSQGTAQIEKLNLQKQVYEKHINDLMAKTATVSTKPEYASKLVDRVHAIDANILNLMRQFSSGELTRPQTEKLVGRQVQQRDRYEQKIGSIDNSISIELNIDKLSGTKQEAEILTQMIADEIEKAQTKQEARMARMAKRGAQTGNELAFAR